MENRSFQAAQRAPRLVNREKELAIIKKAVFEPEADCQIVFLRGKGGMGKSRLAEEILWRGGNWKSRQERGGAPPEHAEWDWAKHGKAVFGDLIDMSATPFQARASFLRAVRDALVWPGSGVDFSRYDAAYDRYQSQRVYPGDFDFLQQLAREAEEQFLQDYQACAEQQRIVLVLDTVEKLYPPSGTELLLQEGLLTAEDMAFYTYQWLLNQIEGGNLHNTTLILVGRAEEGKAFFQAVEQAAAKNSACCIMPLEELSPFSLEDTRAYFQILAEEWGQNAQEDVNAQILADTMRAIAEDEARLETLWIYTGGQPVRLALYTDLIVEDRRIPERLQETPEQARSMQEKEEELEKARREIEAGFIRLLFGRHDLHAAILQILVRTPRGLDIDQLHYCLDSNPDEKPQDWQKRRHEEEGKGITRKGVEESIAALKRLAIVKVRADGRLGLQDEIYRIYKNALAGDSESRDAECRERDALYEKLGAWARYQQEQRLQAIIEQQARDERQLRFERPSLALDVHFAPVPKHEQEERTRLRSEMTQWELENLHYALLRDFTHNFNHELFEMADRRWMAYDEDAGAVLEAELWHLLKDPAYALVEFRHLDPWPSLKRRRETVLSAFERIALQSDACNWIKRFCLRNDYSRAVEFADRLEQAIERWAQERRQDTRFLASSWKHTFARAERLLWRSYACLMRGEQINETLQRMEAAAKELEQFLHCDQETFAFPERQEWGFLSHPAEGKLRRLTALYYNYLGYGCATQGQFSKAKEFYGKAIRYWREFPLPHMEPTTRNNLSRILSERGYSRARRICLDALELRKKQGAEVPIAYSYNTLALIDNDHLRPDLAWIESAIAVAYFRRAGNARGLGLALLQLSESLRRMAKRKSEVYHLRGDSPEVVLETAERAINEAISLFTEGAASGETIRRIEAWIEKGCLERDWILLSKEERQRRHYRDALYYYRLAADLARSLPNPRLELDAQVNMAWSHYYFQDFAEAEKALTEAEKLLPSDCWFQEGQEPPAPERDDVYVYSQLSKMYGLRGRMALERFSHQVEKIASEEADKEKRRRRVHEDSTAQEYLRQAAEAMVLALAYSQLVSPRASALSVIYDTLYEYLKVFNPVELEDFYRHARQAHEKYRIDKVRTIGFGRLDAFMRDSFGLGEEN